MRYKSADVLLERYAHLYFTLIAPKTMTWPDPKSPLIASLNSHPAQSRTNRMLVELSDCGACVRAAQLTEYETLVLAQLYRPRMRYCKRCRALRGFVDAPRCPVCGARAKDGWSFEAFPTLEVLAEYLRANTPRSWSRPSVHRLRNRAFARVEAAMRARGLYDDGSDDEATGT